MSRVRADLQRVSMNQLTQLTGKTHRTLKKILADVIPENDSSTLLYNPTLVLPIIYGVNSGSRRDSAGSLGSFLDPAQEKARLDKVRAEKVEIELDVLRKKLIPVDQVEIIWAKIAGAFRAKILNLPSKVAARVCATRDLKEIEKILTNECAEALTELSHYGDELESSSSSQTSREATGSAAEADSF